MNTFQREIYSDMILSIKCGSYKGIKIKAKPILLLSIIKLIENGLVVNNRFFFDKESDSCYNDIFKSFDLKVTPFFKPFYYLQFDGFWHLLWKKDKGPIDRPSDKYIRESILYAYLDNALWDLLQEKETREYFRTIIENHYLK